MRLLALLYVLLHLLVTGCTTFDPRPETVYVGASLNEDGRTRTYNVGGTWRIKPAPVAKVADETQPPACPPR